MDDIVDDLTRISSRCDRAAESFSAKPLNGIKTKLFEAINSVAEAWSGSWLGYHADVYTIDFRSRLPGEHFDSMLGERQAFSSSMAGEWAEYSYDTVREEILRRAGRPNLDLITEAATNAQRLFDECRRELLPTLEAILAEGSDSTLSKLHEDASKLKSHHSAGDYCKAIMPSGKFFTHDMRAVQGGFRVPPHIHVQAWIMERLSSEEQIKRLGDISAHAAHYIQKKRKMKGKTVAKKDGPIFIGHGRSADWKTSRISSSSALASSTRSLAESRRLGDRRKSGF